MINEREMKEWIDRASIRDLLARNRFAMAGDPFFQGEVGEYYMKVMTEKRKANPQEWVRASRAIGW